MHKLKNMRPNIGGGPIISAIHVEIMDKIAELDNKDGIYRSMQNITELAFKLK